MPDEPEPIVVTPLPAAARPPLETTPPDPRRELLELAAALADNPRDEARLAHYLRLRRRLRSRR